MASWWRRWENTAQDALSRPAPLTWRPWTCQVRVTHRGGPPSSNLQPGLLSKFRHQPFLVLPVTQFMRLTQSSAVPAKLPEAGSELAPHCVPCPTP